MDNGVFISYRRSVSAFIARAVFQDLRTHGIDTFMDVENIDTGEFDMIILNQIAARPYFLLILTPGTLERCVESNDWLLREINHALILRRQIILVHTLNFSFDDCARYLPAPLHSALLRWNAVSVPHDLFDAAMVKLRTRFLKPINLPVYSTPTAERVEVEQRIQQALAEPAVTESQLSAQDYFERALKRPARDYAGKIADYSEAIRLNPFYAEAHNNRGNAYYDKGDLTSAIADYTRSIELNNPELHFPYNNRGSAYKDLGDLTSAIADYSEAIRLNPNYAAAYNNRGNVRKAKGDLAGAIADYDRAIRIKPDYADAYYNRGNARYIRRDLNGAIADYNQAIRLKPDYVNAYYNRAVAHDVKGDRIGALEDFRRILEIAPDGADATEARDYIATHGE